MGRDESSNRPAKDDSNAKISTRPRLPTEPVDGLLFAAVVREALRLDGLPEHLVGDATVADAWARSGGNMRTALERLYRAFEDAVCETAACGTPLVRVVRPAPGV